LIFDKKLFWATFWAILLIFERKNILGDILGIFSYFHLVTLLDPNTPNRKNPNELFASILALKLSSFLFWKTWGQCYV
jgi:hypothetical protein